MSQRWVIYITDRCDPILWNPAMPAPPRHSLRIVVQYLGHPHGYRLIAYGDSALYRPLEFTSRADTLSVLRRLVGDIDESVLPSPDEAANSRIIFTADVTVTESQLQDAGLTRQN